MESPESLQQSSQEDIEKYKQARDRGKEVLLPDSGLVFLVGRPSLIELIKAGVIPDALVDSAIKVDTPRYTPKNKKELVEMSDVIATVVCSAVRSPKLIKEGEPAEGELKITDISERDQIAIYTYIQLGVTGYESFPEKQEGTEPGSDSKKISGTETKPADGDKEPVGSVSGRSRDRTSSTAS